MSRHNLPDPDGPGDCSQLAYDSLIVLFVIILPLFTSPARLDSSPSRGVDHAFLAFIKFVFPVSCMYYPLPVEGAAEEAHSGCRSSGT